AKAPAPCDLCEHRARIERNHRPNGDAASGQVATSARRAGGVSTMARATASCTSRRNTTCLLFERLGLTRLVRKTTKRSCVGSIQMLVPVKPVCPNDSAEK